MQVDRCPSHHHNHQALVLDVDVTQAGDGWGVGTLTWQCGRVCVCESVFQFDLQIIPLSLVVWAHWHDKSVQQNTETS